MDLEFGKKYELHELKRITRIWNLTPQMLQDFEVEFAINKSPSPF